MSALAMLRNMRANLAQATQPMPSRQDLIRELGEIEQALLECGPKVGRESTLAVSLLTLADQGEGSTPAQLGHALDPTKEGYQAGALAGNRLNALKSAGLAQRAHYGWWVLTEQGQREVERLRAEGGP